MKHRVAVACVVIGLGVVFVVAVMWRGGLPLAASVALAASSCDCPANVCANGTVAGCSKTCPQGQDAVCACDGFCDDNGNPGGLNRCACQ
jgi:hypothetical protein